MHNDSSRTFFSMYNNYTLNVYIYTSLHYHTALFSVYIFSTAHTVLATMLSLLQIQLAACGPNWSIGPSSTRILSALYNAHLVNKCSMYRTIAVYDVP